MANSGTVTAGVSAVLASQYNNLRDDVLNITTGHQHTGASEDGRQIPTGGLADYAVTLDKLAYGGMIIQSHQTGASDWSAAGTVPYSVGGTVRIEVGCQSESFADGVLSSSIEEGMDPSVIFGTPFSEAPLVFVSVVETGSPMTTFWRCHVREVGTSNFSFVLNRSNSSGAKTPRVSWMAIGPG